MESSIKPIGWLSEIECMERKTARLDARTRQCRAWVNCANLGVFESPVPDGLLDCPKYRRPITDARHQRLAVIRKRNRNEPRPGQPAADAAQNDAVRQRLTGR